MSIILFLVILAILIAVHEFGHFITAKRSGIRVDEFALGFPPKLFSYKWGETKYSLNVIPFGGFVKIFGEDPTEVPVTGVDAKRSFAHKPRYIQALVLSAGILANVIFAWLLMSISLMIGLPAPTDYVGTLPLQDAQVTVLGTSTDSPAEKAGLVPGDIILYVELGKESLQNFSVEQIQKFIGAHPGENISLLVRHAGASHTVSVRPEEGIVPDRAAIGISLAQIGTIKSSFPMAFVEGAKLTYSSVIGTATGLLTFIKNAVLGSAHLSQVTGPVGIVNMVGEASHFGFAYLLGFTAFISINLAVINVLPFPALDGGRLFFVLIESVIRRSLNARFQNIANLIGFALLISLMLLVTYNDLARLIQW